MSDSATSYRAGLLLESVSRMRRSILDQAMRPHGISPSQWWLLKALHQNEGLSQTEVARQLNMTRVALGELVEKLEAANYIERIGDPSDRRIKRLQLTSKGKDAVDRMQDIDQTVEGQIEGCFTQDEQQALENLLHKLMNNLRSLDGGGTTQEVT